ncbi:hypothetical protein [Ollibium composti]|uniref:Uncharacterized protein n=1 Tax=Ollibium composti TaxID=2675109 RepID=A0ABY2Q6T1_9HYPH|nr:hypothetical protein [Mesorhizobium composti]THF57146.1 hypothetical protein E6C48_12580 [Mesorhizobium composti]
MRLTAQTALGLFALAVSAVALWWLLTGALQYIFGLDKAVVPAVIGGIVAIALAIFAYWRERAKARAEAHRDKKIEVYSIFYDMIFDLLRNQKDGISVDLETDSTFRDRWMRLTRGVMFYGSPHVVEAMANFKTNENTSPINSLQRIGDIYLAMRKDIGLSNWGLTNVSIHQVYVNDDVHSIESIGPKP